MGILVLAVAILPVLGVGGAQAFKAEIDRAVEGNEANAAHRRHGEGAVRDLLRVSLACFIAYRGAGMSWSDAFMHMCSTMGLGGFSSHDESFALLEFTGDRIRSPSSS